MANRKCAIINDEVTATLYEDCYELRQRLVRAFGTDKGTVIEDAAALIRRLGEALGMVAGDGENTRYGWCDHYTAHWGISSEQKAIAGKALTAYEKWKAQQGEGR